MVPQSAACSTHAIAEALTRPPHLSSDHDPLFEFRRWKANLRILSVTEIKTVSEVPLSHPFIERLVGTTRRELLDQAPFWSARDLDRKLLHFRDYYNRDRVHASLGGVTPACKAGDVNRRIVSLCKYQWQSHCRGLYQLPVAARRKIRYRQANCWTMTERLNRR
jgi:putative transposase